MRSPEEEYLAHMVQEEVDLRAAGIYQPTEAERRQSFLAHGYLSQVRKYYGIRSIYYPQCTGETVLETAFSADEIFYLDNIIRRNDNTRNSVVGDILKPPFAENTFDAAYVQDIHIHESPEKLDAILALVKQDGILIYGKRDACPSWKQELPVLNNSDNLSYIQYPYEDARFSTYSVRK